MPLSKKELQEYEALERMFNTEGWTHLVNGFKAERDAIPEMAFHGVHSMEELTQYRIRHELLSQLIGLAEEIRADREALQQEEEDV